MILRYKDINKINLGKLIYEDYEQEEVFNTITESNNKLGNVGIFKSFLKVISSLDIRCEMETTSEFLYFKAYRGASIYDVKDIINRFRSLSHITSSMDYGDNDCDLYFGIKNDNSMEYGFISDRGMVSVGNFEMTDKNIKGIISIDSELLTDLKRELVNLDKRKLKISNEILKSLYDYNPGYYSERVISVKDNIISIYYKGLGKWDNGSVVMSSYRLCYDDFKTYINSKKIGKLVLLAPYAKDMGIGFKIKLK